MNSQFYINLGQSICSKLMSKNSMDARAVLAPFLLERVHFFHLEKIGTPIGHLHPSMSIPYLSWIAGQKAEGGWVVIAAALRVWLPDRLEQAFRLCHLYILQADIWYAADIFGERVPGPALLLDFDNAWQKITPWKTDQNAWIRRTLGVAVHYWAKKTKGAREHAPQAQKILALLEDLFFEKNIQAVKGVGWGLKTLGKYYPNLLAEWLHVQVREKNQPFRKLILKKSLTWLSQEQRAFILD